MNGIGFCLGEYQTLLWILSPNIDNATNIAPNITKFGEMLPEVRLLLNVQDAKLSKDLKLHTNLN